MSSRLFCSALTPNTDATSPETIMRVVVEKRLPDEQREAEGSSPRVTRENRPGDGDEADGLALPHGDLFVHLVKLGVRPVPDGLLDVVD
jgi:hypothetical protein